MSGDIGTIGNNSDNAHHLVIAAGGLGNALLDGFTVKNGRADGSNPITVNSQSVDRGNGGGLFSIQSGVKILNTSFVNNNANHGGAYYNLSTSSIFVNCSIKNNTAQYNGSGGYNNASTIQLINTEISNNTTGGGNGGAMFNYSNSNLTLINCLLVKNSALDGGGFFNLNNSSANLINVSLADNTPNAYNLQNASTLSAKNSIVWGGKAGASNTGTYQNSYVDGASWNGSWGTDGGGNIVSINDPFFDKSASDYRLSPCSQAINAGSNTLYTGAGGNLSTDKDIAGNNRLNETTIDMGAVENILPVATLPVVNLGADITACFDTTVVLDAGNPGMTYLWSDNSTAQTLTVSTPGTHSVTVTDVNSGCSASDAIAVNITNQGLVTISPLSDTICIGDTTILQAIDNIPSLTYCNPPYDAFDRFFTNITYSTINNTSGQSFGPIPDYTSDTAYVNVGISNTLTATFQNYYPMQISIFAYIDWNQNGILIDAGEVYIVVNGSFIPTGTFTYAIPAITPPAWAYNGVTRMRMSVSNMPPVSDPCEILFGEYEDYSVHVSGGVDKVTYNWSDGNSTISTNSSVIVSPTVSTNYSVTITTPSCQKTKTIPVVVNNPEVNLGADAGYCAGTPFTLDAGNAGSSYLWSDNSSNQTLDVTTSGTYSVTVTDGNGCIGKDTITVTE
ncbi:MAG: hypothetical protein IT232_09580, partial [Flavobacteriales bacterium]|nr:hypothetical protein [Flavobacteriales bacterium]